METPTTIVELVAKYDCIMGNNRHYIIGKSGDKITGGIYIRKDIEAPEELVLTFKEKK